VGEKRSSLFGKAIISQTISARLNDSDFMKCMVCGATTLFKYRKQDIEAAFCPFHIPKEESEIERPKTVKLVITIRF
jgi:hypothetical protein